LTFAVITTLHMTRGCPRGDRRSAGRRI
jgi:hypothetical protein